MRTCIFVIGTRAQLVKIAPVLQSAREAALPHVVWFSGQHRESIDELIDDFGLESEFVRFAVASERSTIVRLATWLPVSLYACYSFVRARAQNGQVPLVIVHGDTLSTLVSALAGRIAGAEIVHLESGLTSGAIFDPFPEELIRRWVFRLTSYAVCPSESASSRMARYKCSETVNTRENTLLDSVRYALEAKETETEFEPTSYFVASVHRFQNIYHRDRLTSIVDEIIAVSTVATVIFILHPPTKNRLDEYGLTGALAKVPTVRLESRMRYTRFLSLLANARGVFSDGGSNQEELSYLGVPTVLFRERSERPDGLGRNVILRREIKDELKDYIVSGALEQLRRPGQLRQGVFPSRAAVEALQRWSMLRQFG